MSSHTAKTNYIRTVLNRQYALKKKREEVEETLYAYLHLLCQQIDKRVYHLAETSLIKVLFLSSIALMSDTAVQLFSSLFGADATAMHADLDTGSAEGDASKAGKVSLIIRQYFMSSSFYDAKRNSTYSVTDIDQLLDKVLAAVVTASLSLFLTSDTRS